MINITNSIEDLNGVGPSTARNLRTAGFDTLEKIAYADPIKLATSAGVHKTTALMIIDGARQGLGLPSLEKKVTQAQRMDMMIEMIEKQHDQLVHLDELRRMQALLMPSLLYVEDYDGPKMLQVSNKSGNPHCYFCAGLWQTAIWAMSCIRSS